MRTRRLHSAVIADHEEGDLLAGILDPDVLAHGPARRALRERLDLRVVAQVALLQLLGRGDAALAGCAVHRCLPRSVIERLTALTL